MISALFSIIRLISAPCMEFNLVFAGVEIVRPSPAWKHMQDYFFHGCGSGLGTFLFAETRMFLIQHIKQILDAFIAKLGVPVKLVCFHLIGS